MMGRQIIPKKYCISEKILKNKVTHKYTKTTDLAIQKVKYIYAKEEEALQRIPAEQWHDYIDRNYAMMIVSNAKNWSKKESGESVVTTYKQLSNLLG